MKDLPLNLSKFRKTHSDDDTTTFEHYEGHSIKVAHKKLSKGMRDKLEKLPTAKRKEPKVQEEPMRMAGGGVTPPGPCKNPNCHSFGKPHPNCRCYGAYASGGVVKHQADCPYGQCERYAEGTPSAGGSPLEIEAVDPNSPEAQAPTLPTQMSGTADFVGPPRPPKLQSIVDALPPGEHALSSSTAQNVAGQPVYTNNKQNISVKDHLNAEDQAFQKDLVNGHITPETYESLFAKKSTVGKIGSLFGLLVSGAGSGLSHQPNAVMDMMKNEIQNDLEAQKASKTNAQNFLRINNETLKNKAEIENLKKTGQLTDAQAKQALKDLEIKSYTLSNMQMNRAVLHNLTTQMQKLPPGSPQRAQMEQVMRALFESVNNENFNLSDRANAASSIFGAFPTSGGAGTSGSGAGAQGAAEPNDLGYTPLLHKGAEGAFQGLQYTPKAKEQMGEITKQFTAAQQADKLMPLILRSFDNAVKLRSWTARVHDEINPHAIGGVGGGLGIGVGSMAGGVGAIPGGAAGAGIGEALGHSIKSLTNTDSVRAYEAEKTKLTGFIARALGNTNLGSEEIAKIVKGMVPVAGDSDSTVAEKRQGLIDKIQKIETSLLKTWHLTNE